MRHGIFNLSRDDPQAKQIGAKLGLFVVLHLPQSPHVFALNRARLVAKLAQATELLAEPTMEHINNRPCPDLFCKRRPATLALENSKCLLRRGFLAKEPEHRRFPIYLTVRGGLEECANKPF